MRARGPRAPSLCSSYQPQDCAPRGCSLRGRERHAAGLPSRSRTGMSRCRRRRCLDGQAQRHSAWAVLTGLQGSTDQAAPALIRRP
eukprot:scaffold90364_cov66-Phaeocystis_antarctica.AAC.3